MKKILGIIFTAALIFTSCHDNIFENINNEVKLEKNGINGDGRIVRYKDSLVYCNGHIYYKTNESSNTTGLFNRQWVKVNATPGDKIDYVPSSTHFLAGGNGILFALTYTWYGDSSGVNSIKSKKIYYTKDTMSSSVEWKELSLPESLSGSGSIAVIFDNKAYDESNRKAYARIYDSTANSYSVYELLESGPVKVTDGTNGASATSISAVYFNGQDYFSPYYAMTANDKYIYYSKTVTNSSNHVSTSSIICCADGWGEFSTYKKVTPAADANPNQKQWYEYDENLKVYQLTSDTEPVSQKSYYSKSDSVSTGFRITSSASAPEEIHCNAGGILSLAATKNFLLIGTTGGLKRTELKENIPSADVSKFPNNGNKISEEYIFFVFALNPSANEGEDDEYCNTTIHGSISGSQDSWDDAGLYAYYKNHGTWNRDGTDDNSTNGN